MQAPPRDRTPGPPRGADARTSASHSLLLPVLFCAVISGAAGLVALLILPFAGAVGEGVMAVNERLVAAGSGFTRIPHFPERSTIYASDGHTVLATLYLDQNRQIVHLSHVSPVAQKAVLAIEDHGFYEHGALNPSSVLRALIANLVAGRVLQGGSTITQQLVKNAVIGTDEQTIARKFQEAALAVRVEQTYTKDQILELYVNDVYFGNGIYGIGTASQYYFAEPASKLTLPQSALLAGMIASPASFDPIDHPKRARARRNEVLDRLAALNWTPQANVDRAKDRPIRLAPTVRPTATTVEPFFVRYIRLQILGDSSGQFEAFGKTYKQREHTLFQGGLDIYTTLDPAWQNAAQAAVLGHLPNATGPDAAVVTVDTHTGAIRTVLSGKDYEQDQTDLVLSRRQPGSAFKPFTLVAAFRRHIPPGKVYSSKSPVHLAEWDNECQCVTNAEGAGDHGYLDLWTATQDSVNVVFAQLVIDVGPEAVVRAAEDLGITAPLEPFPSITLGSEEISPLDMASAYATFANDGKHCEPFAVARVLLPDGKKLYQHRVDCQQVISPDIAHLVTAMLQRVVQSGTGTAANLGRPVAGKTGTTQDYTNAWFVGYTPQESTAVWVGYRQGQISMEGFFGGPVFGGTVAAPIWHDDMVGVMAGLPVESFPTPPPQQRTKVPDVVGLRSLAAQQALADTNFTPTVEKVHSPEPPGTVIGEIPAAGTGLVPGSLVTLSVSDGTSAKVAVPDVVGLEQQKATSALETAGFIVNLELFPVTDKKEDGLVIAQLPAGGEKAAEGSSVTIQVGSYSPA